MQTEEEAIAFLNEIRSARWDATHNVYAYALRGGQLRRYSDDGEPQGTAGVPVLEVLTKSGVTDAAVVVTRYFGGVLLGAGGLVRAYSHTARLAVEAGGITVMQKQLEARLCCAYHQYGRLAALLPAVGCTVDGAAFGQEVALSFHFPPEALDSLQKALADATNGQVKALVTGERFFSAQ